MRCRNLTKVLGDLGISVLREKTSSAMDRVAERLIAVWAKNTDLSHRDQVAVFLNAVTDERVYLSEEIYRVLSEAYVSAIFDAPPTLNPEALKVLETLKKREMGIGLICNSGITPGFALRRLLTNYHALEFFDCTLFSDETGVRKPDPRMFRWAAEHLRVRLSEVVHVGDNLMTDVAGAKAAGCLSACFASDAGRDKEAEANPKSLVTLSRYLGKTTAFQPTNADWTIYSLTSILEEIVQWSPCR